MDAALRERVEANLARFARRAEPDAGRRRAAVALALLPDAEGHPGFLLTRRAPHLPSHAGQWALPGGGLEPGESATQAALRELREELGLALAPEAALGLLDDYPTRSGYVITPVVLWSESTTRLSPDPREVAEVHHVPVADLARPDVPHFRRIPESDRPVVSIPLVGTNIHAPTAAILYQLVEVAFLGRPTRVAHLEQPVFAWR
jgi:8-oxo-dGTP pyrophosphatase MutT (NUDIX family)